ncbi:MAG: hypothetical protein GKR88_03370 [Flavobacteriaceae bacterium]|nr:MAG: hypothetical protein GKR88_03370 [Flavobacteriaceae bacterium]
MVSIEPADEENTYKITMIACVPDASLLKVKTEIESAIAVDSNNMIFVKYNGISRIAVSFP